MKIEITRDNLVHALGRVQGIVEKKNTIPILSNVCLEAAAERLNLTATDLEIGLSLSVPAIVDRGGKITVSAKKLFEIVRELPSGVLTLTAEENSWIHIESGNVEFKIVGLSPDEYPFFPDVSGEVVLSLNSGEFKEIISKTSFAMTNDEIKHNLNGIHIDWSEDSINFVATDSHRLALTSLGCDKDLNKPAKGIIIPRKGIIELMKNIEDESSIINFHLENNNIFASFEGTIFFMRLVDGDFPNYRRVVPDLNNESTEIDIALFKSCVRRISVLSNDKNKGINIKLNSNKIEVSSSNNEFGEAKEIIEIHRESEQEIGVGLNAKFLLDVLNNLKNEKCNLYIKDSMSPVVITEKTNINHVSIIMPMTF